MSIEEEGLSPGEHARVLELVRAICAVIENEELHPKIEALVCCLFGEVQVDYDLSPLETVQFCARCIEAYGRRRYGQ